jgi:RNA polymerase sigma factor (sigma-70 family)
MDDREIVAAIVAGDPAGLPEAYDTYAESLYGYCCVMLNEPEDAADALQDTFVIAAARLDGLHDSRKLRPWLYAVARNECHRQLHAAEADLDEAGLAGPSGEAGDSAERAELRRLVRATLDGLNPGEREVIELGLRHDLDGADLAAVLGVPRNQAHALAVSARGRLEKALGTLLVARTGRRACPELDMLLGNWEGRLTALARKRISRHIRHCDVCTDRKHGTLRPAALYGMAPLAALPRGLRQEVLGLCADVGPAAQSYRRDVLQRAEPFRPNGFPHAIRPRGRRRLVLAAVAATAGIVIAMVATGIITVFALGGSHPPHPVDAVRSGSGAASVTASPGSAGAALPSLSPATSAPAVTSAPPAVAQPLASPTKAKPSASVRSSAPPSPTPTPRRPTLTPPPTLTSTPTPTPTVTSTPTSTVTPPGL